MKEKYDSVIKSYHKNSHSDLKIGIFFLILIAIGIAIFLNQENFKKKNSLIPEEKDIESDGDNFIPNLKEGSENSEQIDNEFSETIDESGEIENAEKVIPSSGEGSLLEKNETSLAEELGNRSEESPMMDENNALTNEMVEEVATPVPSVETVTSIKDETVILARYAIADVVVKEQASNSAAVIGTLQEGEEVLLKEEGESWDTILWKGQVGFIRKHFLTSKKIENRDLEIAFKDRGIDPTKPMVALTFDDGPNPISTNRILDTLEQYHVVATFFDLGKLAERYPDVVKREEEIGCEVGSHSYQHSNLIKITEEELRQDIEKSENAFMNVLGHKTNLYRPPYGNINITVKENLDYPLITWNVDSLDWKLRNKTKILNQIRKTTNLDGNIILMHSIYTTTADTVEELVPELIEKGYQLVTVSELAYYKKGIQLRTRNVYGSFK